MRMQLHSFFRLFRVSKKKQVNGYSINLSNEKIRQLIRQMDDLMEQQRPFLQARYTIKSLAAEMRIPSYQLSALLNKQMGTNFNDYLNNFRVKYCKELMHSRVADNLNLKGLSAKCGFNNRNTFTTAFKKFTGQTPSDYSRHYVSYS